MNNNLVYMYRNKINNKKYIGITSMSIRERRSRGYGKTPFANALKKYGLENFEITILAKGLHRNQACSLEKLYIEKYKTMNREYGYNMTIGGDGAYTLYNYSKSRMNEYRKLKSFQMKEYYKNNPEFKKVTAHYGKDNGRYGIGLNLGDNGRAEKTKITMPNKEVYEFSTKKEAMKFLNMKKDMFTRILRGGQPFKINPNMNTKLKDKYKHLEGLIIESNYRELKKVQRLEKVS